jgi:uncharacterized protein (TIGR02588 family)
VTTDAQKRTIHKVQAGIAIVTILAIIIGVAYIWYSPPSPELDAKITSATIQLNNAGFNLLNACHNTSGTFLKADPSCIEGTLSMDASCKTTDQRYLQYLTICNDPRFKAALVALKG